jgi:hypothetical protein
MAQMIECLSAGPERQGGDGVTTKKLGPQQDKVAPARYNQVQGMRPAQSQPHPSPIEFPEVKPSQSQLQ